MTTEQAYERLIKACELIANLSYALEAHHNSNYEYGLIEEAKDFVDKTYDLME